MEGCHGREKVDEEVNVVNEELEDVDSDIVDVGLYIVVFVPNIAVACVSVGADSSDVELMGKLLLAIAKEVVGVGAKPESGKAVV